MSDNKDADYWYSEFVILDHLFNRVMSIMLKINVFDGNEQYQRSIREIHQVLSEGSEAQEKRHKEHADKLIAEAKIRNQK